MVSARYIPGVGDIVWLTVDPTKGHEQAGRRPALVLTPQQYNARTNLAVCCPVISTVKGYPFEVPIDANPLVSGVVLVDQIKSMDWVRRQAARIGRVDAPTLARVRALIKALLVTP